MNAFEEAVLAGVALLGELPRERSQADAARALFRAFQAAHPTVRADLITDWTTAATRVDYDLLLNDEAHGTLALSRTHGVQSPWSIEHAEHWAAQRVLTVGAQILTVHDALQLWQGQAAREPDFMDTLLHESLIARAMPDVEEEISAEELQRTADELRRKLGLHDRARTLAWLSRRGLSLAGLEAIARREIERERWLDRMFAADGRAYFDQHARELERVQVAYARADLGVLETLAPQVTDSVSLLRVVDERLRAKPNELIDARVERCFAFELPLSLRAASSGTLVGPWQTGGRSQLAQVLSRVPSQYDTDVHRAVRTRLFEQWLERERASAEVRWHWL